MLAGFVYIAHLYVASMTVHQVGWVGKIIRDAAILLLVEHSSCSGRFRGVMGVQMHPRLVTSKVLLRT